MLLRGWVLAGDLRAGDSVRLRDGSYALVEAIETVYDPQVMYNVTVAEAHTYFVGEDGCTVHNARKQQQCEVFIRYGSKEEAASTQAASGLVPRPGHERQPKWVAHEKAPNLNPKRLGEKDNYTHRMEFPMQPGTEKWLQEEADKLPPHLCKYKTNEPGCYAVVANLIPEFNKRIIGPIKVTQIRKPR